MKKTNEKFISLIMTAMFTFSITAGIGGKKVNAEEATKDKYKTLLLQEYEKNSDSLKQNSKLAEKYGINLEDGKKSSKYDPNELIRIIVQLDQKPVAEKLKDATVKTNGAKQIENSINNVKDEQRDVISDVEKVTGQKIRRSYGYLLNGFSISAKRKDIGKIEAIDGVKKVTESRVYYPDLKFAHEVTQAYSTWKDLGIKGEGMVISIIDTGIDYSHKDLKVSDKSKDKLDESKVSAALLKHGKFFTDKVPFGYNYADANNIVIDTGVGDMHGMHVAGIVAANGDDKDIDTFNAVKGVAPEAQLLAMKVFSNNPELKGAYDDDIVAAIEDSVKLGADVINMSLGSTAGFQDSEDPQQKAVNNAVSQGTAVVISAGNSAVSATNDGWASPQKNLFGVTDTSTVGDPGLADSSLCVASYENTNIVVELMNYSSDNTKGTINFLPGSGNIIKDLSENHSLELCGLGKPEEFKGKNLTNKIALIQRGGNTFSEKVGNAKNAGAIGVIIYNKSGEQGIAGMGGLEAITLPSVAVSYSDGVILKDLISKNVQVSFSGLKGSTPNDSKSEMSQFTSWGPTPNLEFKPEITAPGGDIYSLKNGNQYQSMSGTSMSSPYTAGSEALIMQAVKKSLGLSGTDLVKFAKNTTMNTASIIMDNANKIAYSPRRQGAGMLQIENAIKNNVMLTDDNGKASVALHEIGNNVSFNLNLKNYGDKPTTYTLASGGILNEVTDSVTGAIKASSLENNGAKMNFSGKSVTVPAKGTAKVTVTINLDNTVDKEQFVEGYVKFNSSDVSIPSLTIPYLGYYGNWSASANIDDPVWSENSIMGITGLGYKGKSGNFVNYGTTYNTATGKGSIVENNIAISKGDTILPQLYMLRNAKQLTVQLLDKDKKVLATLDTENKIRKNVLEDILKGKEDPKEINGAKWDGTIYNSTTGEYEQVADGQYYFRVITTTDIQTAKPQTMDMKVKVDNVAPTVEITSENATSTEYTVTWTGNDALSGINNTVALIDVNGETIKLTNKDAFVTGNNTFSHKVKLQNNANNVVTIAMMDNARNMSLDQKEITLGNAPVVTFGSSLTTLTNKNSYTFEGFVSSNVKTLKINDVSVALDKNMNFSVVQKLKQGDNTFKIVATDSTNKELYNQSFTIKCDMVSPTIQLTSPILKDGIFNTDNSTVNVSGIVQDANAVTAKINGVDASIDKFGNFDETIDVSGLTPINIVVTDSAGNTTTKSITVISSICSAPFAVTFDNLSGMQIVNQSEIKNDTYTITGTVNKMPTVFKINNQDVKINNDMTFSVDYKMQQGINRVAVYAEDGVNSDGSKNLIMNYSYKLIYDSVLPTLTITKPTLNPDGKVYINNDTLTIKGTMSDNTFGYSLYINGNSVSTVDRFPVVDPASITKTFSYDLPVSNNDKVDITLVDELGNLATPITFTVIVDKNAPKAPVISVDNDALTNQPVKVTLAADSSDKDVQKMQYSFDNSTWLDYASTVAVSKNCTVYARIIDLAGNISTVSSKQITNIDMIKPVISVNIENGKSYNYSVKPVITIDKANTTNVYTLDGTTYDGTSEITKVGSHSLCISALDKAGNKSEVTINFTIQVVMTNDSGSDAKAADAVNSAPVSVTTVPVSSSTGVLTSAFVDAIKNSGKNVAVTFNIKDNNNNDMTVSFTAAAKDLKPLDFTLNKVALSKDTILKIDKNAQIISFKENGVLPADTVIRIKVDASKLDIAKDIFLYYYNPTTKKTEQIGEALKVDKDGYVTLTIKHCSDYFLSNNNNAQVTVAVAVTKLVKTGSMVDTNVMLGFGTILAAVGALFIVTKRKEQQ